MGKESKDSDILDFFLAETSEHLHSINDDLLSLEKNKDDRSLVDKIFRTVHAIKGSAGMIGFFVVSDLAHKIEDLLVKMRDRKLDPSGSVMELLFQSVDILAHQIDNISHGQEEDKSILLTFDDLCVEFLGSSKLSNDQSTSQKKAPSSPSTAAASLETEPSETSLAEFYIKQDLFDKAMAIYRKILRHDPSNTTIRQMLEETIALQTYIDETSSSR
jgi:two-component system chemotaxis sensor kinase CheA